MPKILKAEATPNPNAVKLQFDQKLVLGGSRHFSARDEAWESPLAQKLLEIPGVESIFMMEEFLTINKTVGGIWDFIFYKAHEAVMGLGPLKIIRVEAPVVPAAAAMIEGEFEGLTPDQKMEVIDRIMDEAIRPGLARDGGGVKILGVEDNVVHVRYQGACGTCPSASSATLQYITNMLQERVSPNLTVMPA